MQLDMCALRETNMHTHEHARALTMLLQSVHTCTRVCMHTAHTCAHTSKISLHCLFRVHGRFLEKIAKHSILSVVSLGSQFFVLVSCLADSGDWWEPEFSNTMSGTACQV
jgi:hypothetical protein